MSLAGVTVLLLSLVVSTSLLLLVMALVWFMDRYDREPLHTVVAVFIWGAAGAPVLAVLTFGLVESLWGGPGAGPSDLVVAGVMMPLIEELTKALGVLAVALLSRDFDNPTDGFVYGTAAGLGFAVPENYVYATAIGSQPATGIAGILTLVVARTLLSAGVHAVSSATVGGFVGHAMLARHATARGLWALAGLTDAVALHGAWNTALTVIGPLSADGAPRSWLLVLPVIYGAYGLAFAGFLRSEQGILERQLGDEVALGLMPAWIVDVVPYYRRRVRGDWWPARRERTVIARLLTRLAFRKHAIRALPAGEAAIASLEVVRIRQRLRAILAPASPPDD